VEYGVDERHAGVLQQGFGPSPVPSPRAHVLVAVCVPRELHPAAQPRRGRHGKGSLLPRCRDRWQKFANLRALLAWMWPIPDGSCCSWAARSPERRVAVQRQRGLAPAGGPRARRVQGLVAELNAVYRREPALWEQDFDWPGSAGSTRTTPTIACCRSSGSGNRPAGRGVHRQLTPVVRHDHRVGLPRPGRWVEILNTDATSSAAAASPSAT